MECIYMVIYGITYCAAKMKETPSLTVTGPEDSLLWEKVSREWGATPQSKLFPAVDATDEEEDDEEEDEEVEVGIEAALGVVREGARLGSGTEGGG